MINYESHEQKEAKISIYESFARPQKVTEEEVSVSKEKRICLVCKGAIERLNYVCPECNALYCVRCSEVLSKIENACWACETPFHWYTRVDNVSGTTQYYYRDVFRDGQNWTDPQIEFNDKEVRYPMNFFERLSDTVFGLPFYDKVMEAFTIPEVLIAIWPALIVIGLLMTVVIRVTNSDSKKYFKNGIIAALVLLLGFFLALSFSQALFPQLLIPQVTFITMIITVALAAQSVQSNLGGRLFSRGK